jgi:hypothetical protein
VVLVVEGGIVLVGVGVGFGVWVPVGVGGGVGVGVWVLVGVGVGVPEAGGPAIGPPVNALAGALAAPTL